METDKPSQQEAIKAQEVLSTPKKGKDSMTKQDAPYIIQNIELNPAYHYKILDIKTAKGPSFEFLVSAHNSFQTKQKDIVERGWVTEKYLKESKDLKKLVRDYRRDLENIRQMSERGYSSYVELKKRVLKMFEDNSTASLGRSVFENDKRENIGGNQPLGRKKVKKGNLDQSLFEKNNKEAEKGKDTDMIRIHGPSNNDDLDEGKISKTRSENMKGIEKKILEIDFDSEKKDSMLGKRDLQDYDDNKKAIYFLEEHGLDQIEKLKQDFKTHQGAVNKADFFQSLLSFKTGLQNAYKSNFEKKDTE